MVVTFDQDYRSNNLDNAMKTPVLAEGRRQMENHLRGRRMNLKKSLITLAAGCLLSATVNAAPTVEMDTSLGKITVELNSEKAPKSVANFMQYAKDGFYNGTIFHRVIPGFHGPVTRHEHGVSRGRSGHATGGCARDSGCG